MNRSANSIGYDSPRPQDRQPALRPSHSGVEKLARQDP